MNKKKSEQHILQGMKYFCEDSDKAMVEFIKAIKENPYAVEAYENIGILFLMKNEYGNAYFAFQVGSKYFLQRKSYVTLSIDSSCGDKMRTLFFYEGFAGGMFLWIHNKYSSSEDDFERCLLLLDRLRMTDSDSYKFIQNIIILLKAEHEFMALLPANDLDFFEKRILELSDKLKEIKLFRNRCPLTHSFRNTLEVLNLKYKFVSALLNTFQNKRMSQKLVSQAKEVFGKYGFRKWLEISDPALSFNRLVLKQLGYYRFLWKIPPEEWDKCREPFFINARTKKLFYPDISLSTMRTLLRSELDDFKKKFGVPIPRKVEQQLVKKEREGEKERIVDSYYIEGSIPVLGIPGASVSVGANIKSETLYKKLIKPVEFLKSLTGKIKENQNKESKG